MVWAKGNVSDAHGKGKREAVEIGIFNALVSTK